MITIWHW